MTSEAGTATPASSRLPAEAARAQTERGQGTEGDDPL